MQHVVLCRPVFFRSYGVYVVGFRLITSRSECTIISFDLLYYQGVSFEFPFYFLYFTKYKIIMFSFTAMVEYVGISFCHGFPFAYQFTFRHL